MEGLMTSFPMGKLDVSGAASLHPENNGVGAVLAWLFECGFGGGVHGDMSARGVCFLPGDKALSARAWTGDIWTEPFSPRGLTMLVCDARSLSAVSWCTSAAGCCASEVAEVSTPPRGGAEGVSVGAACVWSARAPELFLPPSVSLRRFELTTLFSFSCGDGIGTTSPRRAARRSLSGKTPLPAQLGSPSPQLTKMEWSITTKFILSSPVAGWRMADGGARA
eukprot:scaffold282330_cov33-Tisochrysis_lutea.AAC.4